MNKNLIITVLVAVAATGGGFFGGMKYSQSQRPAQRGQFGNRAGNGARNGFARPVSGEIISTDASSITVKLTDGSSKIVLLSDKTTINKAESGMKEDLKTGVKVAVFGQDNSDGSLTAQNIQINPILRVMGAQSQNAGQKSSDAREIVVEGSNYEFEPSAITVKKGEKVRILFKNSGGMHDFRVDELKIATAVIGSGQSDFVEFTPDKTGSFEFYCSVGNHRATGMKGVLTVE